MACQEIWNSKKLFEQEKQSPVHLQDFMYMHLVRCNPWHPACMRTVLLHLTTITDCLSHLSDETYGISHACGGLQSSTPSVSV